MPIFDSPYTNPDTIQAMYETPEDEVLNVELVLLTGAGDRAGAVMAALIAAGYDPSAVPGYAPPGPRRGPIDPIPTI